MATYPLTRSQEGIWVDYLTERTSTQYNLTLEWNMVDKIGSQVNIRDIVAGRLPIPIDFHVSRAKLATALQPYMY